MSHLSTKLFFAAALAPTKYVGNGGAPTTVLSPEADVMAVPTVTFARLVEERWQRVLLYDDVILL